MDFFFEVILQRFIIRFVGVNIRYFILKFFNTSFKKEDLYGKNDDIGAVFGNDLINALYGFAVLILFFLVGNQLF